MKYFTVGAGYRQTHLQVFQEENGDMFATREDAEKHIAEMNAKKVSEAETALNELREAQIAFLTSIKSK